MHCSDSDSTALKGRVSTIKETLMKKPFENPLKRVRKRLYAFKLV